jgi:hypothetical protein
MDLELIHEDLVTGPGPVSIELFGVDTKRNRRRVYHLLEHKFPGLLKLSDRQIGCLRSVIRVELLRRSGAAA